MVAVAVVTARPVTSKVKGFLSGSALGMLMVATRWPVTLDAGLKTTVKV